MSPKTQMHETGKLAYEGAVDADGHILEPPDLWERYLEPKYRDRALRFVVQDDGLEALEIGGRPSVMSRMGSVSVLGAMGDPDLKSIIFDPARTYLAEAPYGSMDPKERLEPVVLDDEAQGPVAVPRLQVALPEVGRLEDVAVGVDGALEAELARGVQLSAHRLPHRPS